MKPRTHDKGIRYLFALFLVSCISLTLLVLSCTLFQGGASSPSPDMETKLSLSDDPVLEKPVEITFTFNLPKGLKWDYENTTAQIILPEGFELVASNLESHEELIEHTRIEAETYKDLNALENTIQAELDKGSILIEDQISGDKVFYKRYTVVEWHGDVLCDKTYSIQATVKAVKTGDWEIVGRTHYSFPNSIESRGGLDRLYISITEEGATVSEKQPTFKAEGAPLLDPKNPDKPIEIIPWGRLPPPPSPEDLPVPPSSSSSNSVQSGMRDSF